VNSYLESRSESEQTSKDPWSVPGGTALHVAAWNKSSNAVDILLAYGVDIKAKSYNGRTPLHYAVNAECANITSKLLQHGIAPRHLDFRYVTPFLIVSAAGQVNLMPILIQLEDDKTAVDIDGRTVLQYAAQQTQLQAFIYLLDAGWDPYQRDRWSCSPIYYALSKPGFAAYIHAKDLDLSHLALSSEKPIFVNIPKTSAALRFYRAFPEPGRLRYVNSKSKTGLTPLMRQALDGHFESMHISIQAGASLEVCDPFLGTALIISCPSGQLCSVKFLVRQGANLECTLNCRVVTALQAASGQPHVVHWLLIDQYLDQGKLANHPFNSENKPEVRSWSGTRKVQTPLRGRYERPMRVSFMEHARHLHRITKYRVEVLGAVGLGYYSSLHACNRGALTRHNFLRNV
jgi:ankyrin repeat protein